VSAIAAEREAIDVFTDTVPAPGQFLRSQRRTPIAAPTGALTHGFRAPTLDRALTARPTAWPETAAARDVVIARCETEFAGSTTSGSTSDERVRRQGVEILLDWLAGFDAQTWQQRWIASGANAAGSDWTDLIDSPAVAPGRARRLQLLAAAGELIVLDVVRPSYHWLYGFVSKRTFAWFQDRRDRDGFATLARIGAATDNFTANDQTPAFQHLIRILIHNGGTLAAITIEDCLEAYHAQVGYSGQQRTHWYRLLCQAGLLGSDAPPSITAATRKGQRSVAELVDGYRVECLAVRNLLVDYLHERQAALDYTSLAALASKLVLLFWRDLELHEPGIDTLRLSDAVARRWKERLKIVVHGKQRVGQRREDPNAILIAVRAFYTDINHWATEDPARWALWAAPNPITGRDLIGQNKQKHRARARMQQRTRELAPLLPALVAAADSQRRHATELLAAARAAKPGATFGADGERLVRASILADPARGGRGRPGLVWADDLDGRRRNLTFEEDKTFWGWALIEVLRHTGVRIEELTELTHRSFAAYTLPSTGEVIPLLQITPSKTDKERLLVVSPELGEVLTAIIFRVRAGREQLPLVSRYDHAERLHSPPLPFLFQRVSGLANVMVTPSAALSLLNRIVVASGLIHPDGVAVRFTPHDFRRIFATEAVASGLPVHIAAKLLGHESLNTTQGYVAVYDRDVIEHHRAFIARRRTLRPSQEYRDVTDEEWDEFLAHFEKRKVELGICGRAYATPCQHEHACLRCPLLRSDPAQLPRLTEIHTNLIARLAEAHERGWAGEVDGLEVSLAAAEQKLHQMRSASSPTASTSVTLGPTSSLFKRR